ncbi:hypothetical protein BDD43_2041 [Mucilaginibacter gracilis]|uniref:Outer membrane protein with beta-barrel domain n=1 Tax=Mucilaginibacter gracilis TaxID=423350 RepID=A0A495IYU0_9SPHI|nr:hypothetical protein [Mucilaginibacter gracilis]RKR81880.1 hypothetical protein BDD43_2041 [Mucilaginibacter gracilis]
MNSLRKVPSSTETLTKEETGTGYEGDFREGFGYDVFADFYGMFWKKSYIPGIYAEVKYSHGNPWITQDKLALSAGAIFNVTSSDKDSKNLLSIVPYVKWSNVLKEYTDLARSGTSPLHNQFSIGISVGIPINIGK